MVPARTVADILVYIKEQKENNEDMCWTLIPSSAMVVTSLLNRITVFKY